jgi:ABC-type bacteriocin/lantibiotic exporter with double-glycine peptidase domain
MLEVMMPACIARYSSIGRISLAVISLSATALALDLPSLSDVNDANRCGQLSLAVCTEAVGVHISESEWERLFPQSGEPASMAEIAAIAQLVGLKTRAIAWRDAPTPFLPGTAPAVIPIITRDGRRHFVAIIESTGSHVCIIDFPSHPRWVSVSDLRTKWR